MSFTCTKFDLDTIYRYLRYDDSSELRVLWCGIRIWMCGAVYVRRDALLVYKELVVYLYEEERRTYGR